MSRIRSIHPGVWTDDEFMALSAHARLLLIGLWTEAFDDGVFEWKPRTIKARIFPADHIDVEELLAELVEGDFIRKEEFDCKPVGLVRNFRTYQRPKKPNSSNMFLPEWGTYVGLSPDSSEPVPNQSPTGTEKSPQMEDGGGKKEEVKPPVAPQGGGAGDLFDEIVSTFPRSPHLNEAKAEKAFRRLSAKDQVALRGAAKRYAVWFTEEQARRKRTVAEALTYAPPLDKWISEGSWRHAGELRLNSEDAGGGEITVIDANDPIVARLEEMRGKPFIVGTSGKITVRKSELEQARAAA